MAQQRERTFVMVKPDGVHRGLVGTIMNRFEMKGFKLVGVKLLWPSRELVEQHYSEMASRPHFPALVEYMSSGPVVGMVWEGAEAVKSARRVLGTASPAAGTIRQDLCIQGGRDIVHGSDSVDAARKETALWFTEEEVLGWTPANEDWLNKRNE